MPKSLKERYQSGLVRAGYRLVRTGRHDCYAKEGTEGFVYLGSHGSVRVGRSLSASTPMGEGRKQVLLSSGSREEAPRGWDKVETSTEDQAPTGITADQPE